MHPLDIGFYSIPLLLLLIALRVPVGVALGSVSLAGIALLKGEAAAYGMATLVPYEFAAKWELSAIPMFLLMGALSFHTGLTSSLFECARLWLSRIPGGLAVATNFASAGFAAASGSSLATSAAMGRLAIPEMLKFRYDPALATSVVAAAGTLGALIPPSIMLVLYGMFAEQPIGKLLVAGVLPGLLTAAVYALMIIVRCKLNPNLAPPIEQRASWAERLNALKDVWTVPLLIFAVMGSIYSGLATATEGAAIGAVMAFIIAAFRGTLSMAAVKLSVAESLKSTSSIFFIGIGAIFFTRFLALSGVPQYMSGLATDLAVDPLLLMLATSVLYLIMGMFLDPLGLMLLTLPVLLPFFEAAGLNLIWVGIIVVKYIEIGLLTPPVGLQAFVVKGVVGDSVALGTIFKGILWFLGAELVIMALLLGFPSISLWLPGLM